MILYLIGVEHLLRESITLLMKQKVTDWFIPKVDEFQGSSLYQNSSVRMSQRLSLIRKVMAAMWMPK